MPGGINMYKRGSYPLSIRMPLMSTSTGPLSQLQARSLLSQGRLRLRLPVNRVSTVSTALLYKIQFQESISQLEFPVYKFQDQVRYLSVPARKLPGQLGTLPLPRIKQERPATHFHPRRLHTKFKINFPIQSYKQFQKCNSTYRGVMLRYNII